MISIKEKITWTLKELNPVLQQLQDDYFLIGACALILSDIQIDQTSDIDLLTSSRDAATLKNKWVTHIQNYIPSDQHKFRSNFARFSFELLDVEVMGDLEVYSDNEWKRVMIKNSANYFNSDFEIRIPTLKEQVGILNLFGRPKDKEKIVKYKLNF